MKSLHIEPLSVTSSLFEKVKMLYISSFPEKERRSTKQWEKFFEEEKDFQALVLSVDEKVIGFATYWNFDTFLYIEHLAIHKEYQGQGIGHHLVKYLLNIAGKYPLILEVEYPETEQAIRRISFYESLGLKQIDKPYLQPPYRLTDYPFPLILMSQKADDIMRCFEEVVSIIHRRVYRQEL